MSEYVIEMIDSEPAKRWDGPNGTIYYKNVGLAGHPKPVSIGKKTADALKVGDTVDGTIIPTDYLTDKWKHATKPQVGGGTASGGTQKVSEAFLKDVSNTPVQIWTGSLHYAKDLGLNIVGSDEDFRIYAEYVNRASDEMLKSIENIRNGGSETAVPTPSVGPTQVPRGEATPPSLRDNWNKATGDPGPEDENG